MRAHIYHRTSAADHHEPAQAWLDTLNRYAAGRKWTVVGIAVDNHPRHDGPRPERAAMTKALMSAGNRTQVLLVRSLSTLFRSNTDLIHGWRDLVEAGVALVAIEDEVDCTQESVEGPCSVSAFAWRSMVECLASFESRRQSEAVRVGIIRKQLHAAGESTANWSSPGGHLVPVNRLEVKALYEEGKAGKFLSHSAIVREIKRRGGRMSNGVLAQVLRELREEGKLDEAKREQLRKETGRPGGRPRKKISYSLTELEALRQKGLGAKRILDRAKHLSDNVRLHDVARLLKEHEL